MLKSTMKIKIITYPRIQNYYRFVVILRSRIILCIK